MFIEAEFFDSENMDNVQLSEEGQVCSGYQQISIQEIFEI